VGGEPEAAKPFYDVWLNFVTSKEFSWTDQWDVSEAPDRKVRRIMEKDNKKSRDDARREYNDTVRSLARFVRKRDPRYKAHLKNQSQNVVSPVNAEAKNGSRIMGEVYVEQEWQKINERGIYDDLEWTVSEGNDAEEWECVVCNKTFRSEAAWDSHERSKKVGVIDIHFGFLTDQLNKHMKEVERLKWEMQVENEELELGEGSQQEQPPEMPRAPSPVGQTEEAQNSADSEIDKNLPSSELTPNVPGKRRLARRPETASESQTISRTATQAALVQSADAATGAAGGEPLSKREKRRLREAQKSKGFDSQLSCNLCKQSFPSKTKLFAHINETGHAIASPTNKEVQDKPKKANKGRR
jgi:DnaJ family protein A protein 5